MVESWGLGSCACGFSCELGTFNFGDQVLESKGLGCSLTQDFVARFTEPVPSCLGVNALGR